MHILFYKPDCYMCIDSSTYIWIWTKKEHENNLQFEMNNGVLSSFILRPFTNITVDISFFPKYKSLVLFKTGGMVEQDRVPHRRNKLIRTPPAMYSLPPKKNHFGFQCHAFEHSYPKNICKYYFFFMITFIITYILNVTCIFKYLY